jgi:NDP-sugar pyrophosphorylase family protein
MKGIILVGGFGTRLRPLTANTPKPIIPIVNKPFLIYQIELLKMYGVNEIILATGHLSQTIKKVLGGGEAYGVKLIYSLENQPLGTGGAVKLASKYLDGQGAFILNGDVLTDINLDKLLAFHKHKKAKVTISLVAVADPTKFGLVETDENNQVRAFVEKPGQNEITTNMINAGAYYFENEIFEMIPAGVSYSLERGLYPMLLDKKIPFYAYNSTDYWLDIGTPKKYLEANKDVLEDKVNIPALLDVKKSGSVFIGEHAQISKKVRMLSMAAVGEKTIVQPGATITDHSVVGNHCIIEEGAQILGSIILDNSFIGKNSRIVNAIIGQNCKIMPYTHIEGGLLKIIGDGAYIPEYSII